MTGQANRRETISSGPASDLLPRLKEPVKPIWGTPRPGLLRIPLLAPRRLVDHPLIRRIGARMGSNSSRWPASAAVDRRGCEPRPPRLGPSTHPATSRGRRRAIATSAATIRVPVDRQTIDHRERLWTGGVKSRPAHLRFFSKKPKNDPPRGPAMLPNPSDGRA